MKIVLTRQDSAYHILATNEDGNTVDIDGAESIGGNNKGFRPMQLMAASAGSCSSVDIISILKKQRQPLEDFSVEIEAEREKGKIPSLFTHIHLNYTLGGNLEDKKVEKAIKLSLEKYCSAIKILEKSAKITYSYTINRS